MTYAPAPVQHFFPTRTLFREAVLQAGSVLLLAALARVSLPWQPVPLTGQTLGVLLVGGWLGFRRGVLAIGLYIAAGACGLPVFASGTAGPVVLAGPTGGYLIGFIASAGTAGLLGEHRFFGTFPKTVFAMVVATVPIFLFGLAWLAAYVPAGSVFQYGFWPFLPGAIVKLGVAATVLRATATRSA